MNTIYKYAVSVGGATLIYIPIGATIVHVAEQDGIPTLWAKVNTNAPLEYRSFVCIGTGQMVPNEGKYIGTAHCGRFVWHMFEVAQ